MTNVSFLTLHRQKASSESCFVCRRQQSGHWIDKIVSVQNPNLIHSNNLFSLRLILESPRIWVSQFPTILRENNSNSRDVLERRDSVPQKIFYFLIYLPVSFRFEWECFALDMWVVSSHTAAFNSHRHVRYESHRLRAIRGKNTRRSGFH